MTKADHIFLGFQPIRSKNLMEFVIPYTIQEVWSGSFGF